MKSRIILLQIILTLLFIPYVFADDNCVQISESCVEGAETRIVNGVSVHRACWKYRTLKRCSNENYDQECLSYKQNPNCGQINSVCIDSTSAEGGCNLFRNTFSCSSEITPNSNRALLQCGSNLFCANGQCDIPSNSSENNFGQSISQLAVINEAAKDNNKDYNNLRIFSGHSNGCDKSITGYNNCCKDEGWGQDFISASCSESENRLIQQKQRKLCHYVGEYCSREILGQCIKRTKSYCCFGSKISRVVVEQGRAQLGISWGDAENPECRGFTPDELKTLHFDQMDFTEIKDDITASITLPNTQVFENRVRQKMQTYEVPAAN